MNAVLHCGAGAGAALEVYAARGVLFKRSAAPPASDGGFLHPFLDSHTTLAIVAFILPRDVAAVVWFEAAAASFREWTLFVERGRECGRVIDYRRGVWVLHPLQPRSHRRFMCKGISGGGGHVSAPHDTWVGVTIRLSRLGDARAQTTQERTGCRRRRRRRHRNECRENWGGITPGDGCARPGQTEARSKAIIGDD